MITIRLYQDGKGLVNTSRANLAEIWSKRTQNPVWVDIESPEESELRLLTDVCNFHPLTVDDSISEHHQPKIDEFEDYLFMVFRSVCPTPDEYDQCFTPERHTREYCNTLKLSAFLGKDFLVTIHDRYFQAIHEVGTLVDSRNLIMERYLDQVLHAIVDRMIDGAFPVLEELEEQIEHIEAEIFSDTNAIQLSQILKLKRELLTVRRLMSPQREMLARLSRRDDIPFIQAKTTIYFRDVFDHASRIEETALVLTDLATGVAEAHLSVSSNRMNEVMKFLTIFSTIWMPLTFIAGIYGMNFDFLPELHFKWSYPLIWLLMIAIVLAMLAFFRRKKWL